MIRDKEFITVRSLESGTIFKRTDGILVLRQASGRDNVTLKEIKDQLAVFLEIQKGERSPLLVVTDQLKKLENEEKMFLTGTVTQFASRIGIVAINPIPAFIFNILIFLYRPAIPAKIFKREDEALEWLKQN